MPATEMYPGFAVVCREDGQVVRIIRDDSAVLHHVTPGQNLRNLFHYNSVERFDGMLAELRERGAALDWQLDVTSNGALLTLTCGGIGMAGLLTIVAMPGSYEASTQAFEDLMRMNNEQLTALRAALAERDNAIRSRDEIRKTLADLRQHLRDVSSQVAAQYGMLASIIAEIESDPAVGERQERVQRLQGAVEDFGEAVRRLEAALAEFN